MGFVILAAMVFLSAACSDDKDGHCLANVDCSGVTACVHGKCISDTGKCDTIGAFQDVYEGAFLPKESLQEIHAKVDSGGAVHLCYYGMAGDAPAGFYAKQTSSDEFTHIPLGSSGATRCGAIAVSSTGTPWVVSRNPPSLMMLTDNGGWGTITLDGLQGIEAKGAVAGDRALISLTPDDQGGMYVSMSLGYQLESQPVYLAHALIGELEVLVNGWSESGDHTDIGHAPQVLGVGPQLTMIMGNVLGFDIVLADEAMIQSDATEGLYPRAAVGADGTTMAAYLDHNYRLRVDVIEDGLFEEHTVLGVVGIDESSDGQVPWELDVDAYGTGHLLIEDKAQGSNALVYRSVNILAEATEPVLLTTEMVGDLPGMQRYALGTDICGRATVVTIEEHPTETGVETAVKIVEGR